MGKNLGNLLQALNKVEDELLEHKFKRDEEVLGQYRLKIEIINSSIIIDIAESLKKIANDRRTR